MDDKRLILTKLSHPQPSRWHLPRHHLTEILTDASERRLTALVAAAGHGKTCTLAHFLGESGMRFVWYQLEPGDSSLVQFVTYLALGIEQDLAGGNRTSSFLANNPGSGDSGVEAILPLLVQDLHDVVQGAIVLDDFHLISPDSPVGELVAGLLQHGHPAVPFFITSRTALPFPTARLKASLQAEEILQEDLRFTPGEVQEYLRAVAGLALDDASLQQVCHLTEGWPAALVLLASASRRRGSLNLMPDGGLPSDLFAYLAEEVYSGLPVALQRFMEESSILDACSPGPCHAILGRRDPAASIRMVMETTLLLTRLGPDSFRYHHLMQRFLQERLRLRDDGEQWRTLHKRAGDWYLVNDQPEEGVRHFLHGGWVAEGARIVEELAPLWIRSNMRSRLWGMLAMMPSDIKENHPWIAYCEARHELIRGSHAQAMGLGRLALKRFVEKGDRQGAVHAHTLLGQVHVAVQEYDLATAAYQEAAKLLSPELRYEEGVLLCRRAMLAMRMGGSNRDVEGDLQAALAICAELGDAPGESVASDLLGVVRLRQGDYPSAVRYLERSVQLFQTLGEPQYELGLNLAWVYFQLGRFSEATTIWEPVSVSSRFTRRRAHAAVSLVQVYTRLGEFPRGLAAARSAHALISELGDTDLQLELGVALSGLYRLSGQGETAMGYAKTAVQGSKQTEDASSSVTPLVEAALLHLFHTSNAAGAARLAAKALSRLPEDGERWNRLILSLAAALAEFRLARTESRPEAVRLLKEALAECSRRGYQSFVLHEWELALAIILYALSHGAQPDFCLDLVRLMKQQLPASLLTNGIRLHERDARVLPAAWHVLPDDESRQALDSLLSAADRRRVANLSAAGPSPILIRCLGPLSVKVADQPIHVKVLKARKSGQLLTMLLAQKGPVPREHLIDQLWPDLDGEAADTSLRVGLYHLRRILEPHLGGKSRSRYVQSEGGLVWFVRHPEVHIDVDRFREAVERADMLETTGDLASVAAAYEESTRLYLGDLCEENPFSDAIEEIRVTLRSHHCRGLEWLGRYYWKEAQDPARAILCFKQLLSVDATFEPAHQALIQLYVEDGQVAMARTQYISCRDALDQRLGVSPSRATQSLLQLVLSMEYDASPKMERSAVAAAKLPPERAVNRRK